MVVKKIYLLVKAYPEKSKKHGSSICSAGLTSKGEWIRIYPIDLNYYNTHKNTLKKWNFIEGDVGEASEKLSRRESFKINEHSIKLIDDSLTKVNTSKKKKQVIWNKRNDIILPHLNSSIEEFNERKSQDNTYLGLIKPKTFQFRLRKKIQDIEVKKSKSVQQTLDGNYSIIPDEIEKAFSYKFWCENSECKGHDMICEDWELLESFRKWKKIYENPVELEEKLVEKFDTYMKTRNLHFIVGTTSGFGTWVIIGLYYSPKAKNKPILH